MDVPSAIGKLKAERIRKGQEQGSKLQGNKGKPIPPGIILILETAGSPDSGSINVSLQGRGGRGGGRRRGPQQDISQEKCATPCPNRP